MDIKYGYCHCGCGGKTNIPHETNRKLNRIKGQPMKYLHGHNGKGHLNGRWKGGISILSNGGISVKCPLHPRSDSHGYVRKHFLVFDSVINKLLPNFAVIHHIDHNPKNNKPTNLVVCENHSYHMLLHEREKALKMYGNVNLRRCLNCHKVDYINNMVHYKRGKNSGYKHRRGECPKA